ncbi:MAG: hypothetical protein R6U98_08405 [Pirellulaceae bacterium]
MAEISLHLVWSDQKIDPDHRGARYNQRGSDRRQYSSARPQGRHGAEWIHEADDAIDDGRAHAAGRFWSIGNRSA